MNNPTSCNSAEPGKNDFHVCRAVASERTQVVPEHSHSHSHSHSRSYSYSYSYSYSHSDSVALFRSVLQTPSLFASRDEILRRLLSVGLRGSVVKSGRASCPRGHAALFAIAISVALFRSV